MSYLQQTKKIFFGLGNPSKKYENTRHNAGVRALSFLKNTENPQVQISKSLDLSEVNVFNNNTYLFPNTYMNESGAALIEYIRYYKINALDLYLLFDDLDIKIGKYKITEKHFPKDHNGVSSTTNALEKAVKRGQLASYKITAIRIGIDGREGERIVPSADYVLGKFTAQEIEIIDEEVLPQILADLKV